VSFRAKSNSPYHIRQYPANSARMRLARRVQVRPSPQKPRAFPKIVLAVVVVLESASRGSSAFLVAEVPNGWMGVACSSRPRGRCKQRPSNAAVSQETVAATLQGFRMSQLSGSLSNKRDKSDWTQCAGPHSSPFLFNEHQLLTGRGPNRNYHPSTFAQLVH
jgi:hypothetical protein